MANPLPVDRHVSVPLTNVSIAYAQDQDNFVARKVFPVVPVDKQYDKYYVFATADINRVQMKLRAPATESAEVVYRLSSDAYNINVYSGHIDIGDQDRANADDAFQLDSEATEILTGQALLQEEVSFATKYMAGSVWGSTLTGVASGAGASQFLQWNDGASSPIEAIDAGSQLIWGRTGIKPNTLVLTPAVWSQLKNHPDVVDRIKYGAGPAAPAMVQRQALAQLLELDNVYVMGGIINTAAEGQTEVSSFIGGKGALLVYAPPSAGRRKASAGYTFAWRAYLGGTSATKMKRFRIEEIEADRIEISSAYVQQVTGTALGVYFATAVA